MNRGTRNERPLVKVILLGACGVGKTALLNRFCDGRFTPNTQATIGVDFKYRDIELDDGITYRLHVWDTAGQDQFHVISKPYYRQADGVVLVYDCTSPSTLQDLERYVAEARDLCPLGVSMALIGNKCDLHDISDMRVPRSTAEQFAKRRGVPIYFETSAASGDCVDEAFAVLCRYIVNNRRTACDLSEIGGGGIQEGGRRSAGRSDGSRRAPMRLLRRTASASDEPEKRKKCGCSS